MDFSGPLGLKWRFFWGRGKIGKGWYDIDPQQTRFYLWGFLRLCQFWWKSIKKCDRESAFRWIHRYGTDKHDTCTSDYI